MSEWVYIALIGAFFLVAALYASAGFGGGSSYLALLAMVPLGFATIRSTALICNLVVVSGSLSAFLSSGEFSRQHLKRMLPLVVASVPIAFLAGKYVMTERTFFTILGMALIASSLAMFISTRPVTEEKIVSGSRLVQNATIGGLLGGLAGLVGIGGGIFLSPYLHLTNWDTARKISLTTAFFIFVNSLAGLFGQALNQTFDIDYRLLFPLAAAVLAGGQIGIRTNIRLFSNQSIRKITAVVIFLAGCNVLRKYGFT